MVNKSAVYGLEEKGESVHETEMAETNMKQQRGISG
jgi:hypothetical protein